MFNQMDDAFARTLFEPITDLQYMIRTFLVHFDAIFTLNQDLLLGAPLSRRQCVSFIGAEMVLAGGGFRFSNLSPGSALQAGGLGLARGKKIGLIHARLRPVDNHSISRDRNHIYPPPVCFGGQQA
jgi:hypothetical protein